MHTSLVLGGTTFNGLLKSGENILGWLKVPCVTFNQVRFKFTFKTVLLHLHCPVKLDCFLWAQVCVAFNPQSTVVATGSMDTTAKLWDVQKGAEISTLSVSPQLYIQFLIPS